MLKPFKAIAAMSQNRVIGADGKIPWHLPEDFKWFKKKTTGHVLVMGRKTYESIGRPLPNRTTIVLSRSSQSIPGVEIVPGLNELEARIADYPGKEIFICGGAQIYKLALPLCSELYLTLVKRQVLGDTFFPTFEDKFVLAEEMLNNSEFSILHYRSKTA